MKTLQGIGSVLLVLVAACTSVEIRDGDVAVTFDDCPGQAFTVLIEQSGGGTTPNRQEGHAGLKPSGGKIRFRLDNPGKFDFSKSFKITITPNAPLTECEFAQNVWVFEGVPNKEPGTFEDVYFVKLRNFNKH